MNSGWCPRLFLDELASPWALDGHPTALRPMNTSASCVQRFTIRSKKFRLSSRFLGPVPRVARGGGSYPWVSWGRGIEKPEAKKQWKPWVWTTAHVLQERLLHHPLRNLHWKKLSKAESSFIIIFFSLCFVPVVGQGMTLLGGSAKCPLYTTSSITSSKCVNDPTILDEDQGRFVIAKGRSTDARWSFGGLKRWIILLSSLRIFCFLIMKYFEGFFFFLFDSLRMALNLDFGGPNFRTNARCLCTVICYAKLLVGYSDVSRIHLSHKFDFI